MVTTQRSTKSRLTTSEVWDQIGATSFAVLCHVTPSGEPRSSGIVYAVSGRRLYAAVAPDSWKARHIAADGHVSVTVPVQRGRFLALFMPLPPATISFIAAADVHPPDSPTTDHILRQLGSLVPHVRRGTVSVIEIVPEGTFLTYGVGIPLRSMRDPVLARARVPVGFED